MTLTVYIAMFGWPIVSIALFLRLSPRRAVLASILAGWLLLPQAAFSFSGLPEYTRFTAVHLGTLIGVAMFDGQAFARFRPRWFDLPMAIWCICPFASSITNGLGVYDGLSAVFTQVMVYAIPYFFGRVYCQSREGMRDLALAIFIGGVCYLPLIVWELRMSPQLHRYLYGYMQIPFHMIWRLGWYRPLVFMSHGLELGIFMAGAALSGLWLWRSGSVRRVWSIPIAWPALATLGVALACRALNGYGMLLICGVGLWSLKVLKTRGVVLALVLLPILYIGGRVLVDWRGEVLINQVASFNEKRAASMNSRIAHEVTLIDRALERPVFGWGGWNRNRATGDLAEGAMGKRSITDSFWIIAFGQKGLVGLTSVGLVLLGPVLLLLRGLEAREWASPQHGMAAVLAAVLLGFTYDRLFNGMLNPIYFTIAGGLMAYAATSGLSVATSRRTVLVTREPSQAVSTVPESGVQPTQA